MKLSRKWLMVIALVVSMTMAISGTMAYLSDTDSRHNVMVLGSVKIEQHEYERELNSDGSYKIDTINGADSYVLKDFSQGKPLYPATEVDANNQPYNFGAGDYDGTRVKMSQVDSHGSMDVFVSKNAQDKFVTVENTGKSDAYVRTLIAFELGDLPANDFDNVIRTSSFMKTQGVWKVTDVGVVEIDDNNYFVCEYLYNGAKSLGGVHENGVLPKGDTTYPSLAQVYMTATATNEDCELIDGNGNGNYDILVLSQAIQTEGFANAETALDVGFGDANVNNCKIWFGGTATTKTASNAAELKAALAAGGEVWLTEDVNMGDVALTIPADKAVTLNLGGKTLTVKNDAGKASSAIENKGNLTLTNGTVTYAGSGDPAYGYGTNTINNSGSLVIDGATIINTTDGGSSNAIDNAPGSKLVINSGTIKAEMIAIRVRDTADVTINGGEVTSVQRRATQIHLFQGVQGATKLTINGGTFNGKDFALYSYAYGNVSAGNTTVNITGGTFNGDVAFGGGNKIAQETVNITGGAFNGELGRYLANDGWVDIAKP